MEKQKQNSKVVEDERTEAITNKYAANAFNFLVYYLGFSMIIKSFTLDVNIFLYYDYAIAMVIGAAYMIYRSANDGVAVSPSTVKVLNSSYIKGFSAASFLFGLFVTFVISGMDERMAAFFPGVFEKLAGAVGIGILFFVLMISLAWLMDVLPTQRAFSKAAELAGEPGSGLPDEEEVVKQSYVKDERIDSTIEKYAADAFYFVFGYILVSTMVKFFIPGLSMIVYYDVFLAAMAAAAYFSYNILKAGVYHEPNLSRKDKIKNGLLSVTACLTFGMFMSFIMFPIEENWASVLDGTGLKIAFGVILAVFFGSSIYLFGKVADWYAKKRTEKLMNE